MDLAVCSRFISIFIIFTTHTACVSANSTCGGKITGEGSGRITSPFYPQMYPKNSNCEWTIVTDIGTGMRIEIEHLNNKELSNSGSTGRCYDTLDIYRVLPSGADEQVTPSLCASSIAELDICVFDVSATDGSTEVKILFKSDYAVQMSGFSLSFYASCNVTLQGSSGVITSPGYPSDYPKNTVCTTRIVTPTNTRVHLNFLRFFLEDSVACTSDYMSIESSQTGNGIAEVPQRFCGERNPHQIVASSNDIVITFVSDGSFQKYGFDAEWSTDFATQASTEQTSTMETPSTAKPTTVAFISTFAPSFAPDLGHQTPTPEYTGTCAKTITGKTCQRWDSNSPHKLEYHPVTRDHNFCRKVDFEWAWCYTTDNNTKWEYCDVEHCIPDIPVSEAVVQTKEHQRQTTRSVMQTTYAEVTSFPPTFSNLPETSSTKPGDITRHGRAPSNLSDQYSGTCDHTATGLTCQRWDSTTPHSPKFVPTPSDHNFCRNPDNDPTPWCYTTDPETRWEYCYVANCVSETTTVSNTLAIVRSTKSTFGVKLPAVTTGTNETSVNTKSQVIPAENFAVSGSPWLPYVLVAIFLVLIAMVVFGVVCLRKRQKKTRHPPFTSDVTFSQLSEENGDPYLRPRDNTYVEIPFLSQDLPVVLNRVSETPPLPERHASAASLDSIAEAKLKAALDDKANQSDLSGEYCMGKDVPASTEPTTENPYAEASDEPEFMLHNLPVNEALDNPYQQIDYTTMEHTKRAKSKTQSASSSSKLTDKSKSKKNTWTRMFKKAASAQQLTGANPPTPTQQQTPQTPQTPKTPQTPQTPIQKRPPQPIPRAVKDTSPDKTNSIAIHNPSFQTISPEKEDNPPSRKVEVVNEPPLVPEKTRASVLSNGSEDVFNDNAELSHYQSPTAIHEKFPSLNNCCAYASTTSNEAAPCYDCPKSASMCDVVPLAPHDSFKVSINPTLIDNGNNENDGFYDVPSSPQFDIQPQSTTLYDIPKNSRGDSNTSTNTEDSYCSMVSVKPRTKKQQKSKHSSRKDEPSVYTSMKLSGTQYENMSYGMKR